MKAESNFDPNWFSAPGETIADMLAGLDLSLAELASLLGYSHERTERLLSGRAAITLEVARRLERSIGGSIGFWMARENQYRDDVGRLQSQGDVTAAKVWLSELPRKDMVKFGWIRPSSNPEEAVNECLRFFGVTNVSAWRSRYQSLLSVVAFRTSATFDSEPGAVMSWLRFGEVRGAEIQCKPWSPGKLENTLREIRRLTRRRQPHNFVPELQRLCAECGVALVIARTPRGCSASGATRFLSPKKALILLSFRHLSDDHFWFSFFHECGHLLLHSKTALFLEDGSEVTSEEEAQANRFAENVLIPDALREELENLPITRENILRFAVKAGVSRGIVVGQLQHMCRLPHDRLNTLKRRYRWEMVPN